VSDLGRDYETSLDPRRRRRDGVHYTPRAVADELVSRAFSAHRTAISSGKSFFVCDPTCGAGVFLLAAADALVAGGRSPIEALTCLRGMDIDPEALALAQGELCLWAESKGVSSAEAMSAARFTLGDALNDPWPEDGHLDVVVGNPPFGGQLAGTTVRSERAVRDAARILGKPAGYTDTAGVLLVRALDAVGDKGSVVFVQPLSVLGSRDGATVRDRIGGALESIWIPDGLLFDAAVSVCAPVLRKATMHSTSSRSWTEQAADALGVPNVQFSGAVLGTRAQCTAGFRQEFYEISASVVEENEDSPVRLPKLITVGLIDPGKSLWGERDARVAGVTFQRPVVNLGTAGHSRKVERVLPLRRQPKVLVATQTRVIEAVADHDGMLWPSVPVLSVLPTVRECREGVNELELLVAALIAPPASVWAARQAVGTARSPGALRLSARMLEQLPLPIDDERWLHGARQLRNGEFGPAAQTLTEAYGLGPDETHAVLSWWTPRSMRRQQG